MTEFLFQLSFLLAAPFWALMILAPAWRRTRAVAASPLVVVPALAVCLVLLAPVLPAFAELVTRPDLAALQEYVRSPEALAALWAQVIAWDLMVGRWMYLDARERGVPAWAVSPLLLLTVFASPLTVPVYLVARHVLAAPAAGAPAPARVL